MIEFFFKKMTQLRQIHLAHYSSPPKFDQTRLVIFIILLVVTSQLSLNLYLPSLPSMVQYFKTNVYHIQLSIILYLLGYGTSQFFYGPLSDVYGRRWIILIGLSTFVFASLICVSVCNIYLFLFGRLLQGIGMGCGDTMGRAILCERFDSKSFIKAASQISVAAAITPMIGPVLGGYIEQYFGWRTNFLVIFLYGINITFLMLYCLPETKPAHITIHPSIKNILTNYFRILTNRTFIIFFLPGMACFVGETIYNLIGPFLLQNQLHWNATAFGWLNTITIIGLLGGSLAATYLAKKIPHAQMVFYGMLFLIVSSIVMIIPSLFHTINTYLLIIPMALFMAGIGMIYPNTNMGALSPFTTMAGTAGALQGGLQMISGGILGIFISNHSAPTLFTLASSLIALSAICLSIFGVLLRTHSR